MKVSWPSIPDTDVHDAREIKLLGTAFISISVTLSPRSIEDPTTTTRVVVFSSLFITPTRRRRYDDGDDPTSWWSLILIICFDSSTCFRCMFLALPLQR